MNTSLVSKLIQSFDELDRCISLTKDVLAKKNGVPESIIQRVNQYSEIVSKQRILAQKLQSYLTIQDWEEVGRHVRLINGLSSMIRDDAQAILLSAYENKETRKESYM